MTERDQLEQVRAALLERRRDAFAPGFADRAVARWRRAVATGLLRAPELTLDVAMGRYFVRLVPYVAAAVVLLALHNLRNRTTGQSVLAALFGPPSATAVTSHLAAAQGMRPLNELYDLSVPGSGGTQ